MISKPILAAGVAVLMLMTMPSPAAAQKLVFVVRHAERADGGAAAMQKQTDPPLSPAGFARAEKLSAMLAEAGIKAIYATEFQRTGQTAASLAKKLGLTIHRYSSRDNAVLIQEMQKEYSEKIVLIVGHSNTVPGILKALGGPDLTLGEDEFDNLFIILPGTGILSRIRFTP